MYTPLNTNVVLSNRNEESVLTYNTSIIQLEF